MRFKLYLVQVANGVVHLLHKSRLWGHFEKCPEKQSFSEIIFSFGFDTQKMTINDTRIRGEPQSLEYGMKKCDAKEKEKNNEVFPGLIFTYSR